MALIGSFALLLAFALSVYSFGGGLLALFYKDDPFWNRVGETARRAGVVVFGLVFLAAVALVVAAFRDDFDCLHLSSQQPRPAWALQVRYALVRTRRLSSFLVFTPRRIRFRLAPALQN